MHVLSVNVGVVRSNPWKETQLTGIDKRPVEGPVAVTAPGPKGNGDVGLAGDHAFDVKHHGGTDQAVYAFAREDLDGWEPELGRELPDGVFGENLTTSGVDVTNALIGERWRIGDTVVLQVTFPRVPCSTFAGWLQRRGWVRRFTEVAAPGAYLSVIVAGSISAGDAIEVISRPAHGVTIRDYFLAWTTQKHRLPDIDAQLAASPD